MATIAVSMEEKLEAIRKLSDGEKVERAKQLALYLDRITERAMILKEYMLELMKRFPELHEDDSWTSAHNLIFTGESRLRDTFGSAYATATTNNHGTPPFESKVVARRTVARNY